MKAVKLFLFLFLFFIAVAMVDGAATHNYTFDSDATDGIGSLDGSVTGATPMAAFLNNGYYYDAIDDFISYSGEWVDETNPFSMVCWVYLNSSGAGEDLIAYQGDNSNSNCWFTSYDYANHYFFFQKCGVIRADSTETWAEDAWFMHTYVHNSTSADEKNKMFANTTKLTFSGAELTTAYSVASNTIKMGESGAGDRDFLGYIDECSFYDSALTDEDITAIYNGFTAPPAAGATLTLKTSLVNKTQNYNLLTLNYTYNGTYTDTTDFFNCSIYYDGSLNKTTEVNLSNNTLEQINLANYVNTLNISINCSNPDVEAGLGTYNYKIDTVNPVIDVTGLVNQTTFGFFDILTVTANFTDYNLYAYNISIFNALGEEQENIFAEGSLGTEAVNISSRSLSSLGNFTMRFEVWDSHTAGKASPLSWMVDGDNLVIDGDLILNGDIKYLQNDTLYTYFYLSEDGDKYKLKITFNDDAMYHDLLMTAQGRLAIVANSGYMGHFVYWGEVARWIDFEGKNIDRIDITQVGANAYNVRIWHNTRTDEVELESIGDLNYATVTYAYTVEDESISLLNDIKEEMNMIAMVILYVGIMFFLIYISTTLSTRDENDEIMPITSLVVLILYVAAGFMAYMGIQMSLGIGLANAYSELVLSGLRGVNYFFNGAVIILLLLIVVGGIITGMFWNIYKWIERLLTGTRPKSKRG